MRKTKRKNNKTRKQSVKDLARIRWQRFADFIAQGKTEGDAYRLAGYASGSDETNWANASRLLRNPKVKELVRIANEKASSERIATAIEIKELYTKTMRDGVKDVLETKDGVVVVPAKLCDRLRAADSLAKIFGLFNEKTDGKLVVTIRRGGDSAASLQKREGEG